MSRAFVSYSWDSDQHKSWVAELASRLCSDGVEVTLDQWHLVPGDQLPQFMERAVRESDYVLIVCTHRYKIRSDSRLGGAGYEGDIMSGEVLTQGNQRKFIPILRELPWSASAPTWITGKYYIDLSDTPYPENQYHDLLTTLLGTRPSPPPVGLKVIAQSEPSPSSHVLEPAPTKPIFEPIKILGVIVDEVGIPRGDGARGSGLYDIPFRLSRQPPHEWANLFIASWNHPPRFSTMHRPGIASVVGDTIHLDGTTIYEVQRYHRDTLILSIEEANKKYIAIFERQYREQERERQRIQQHKSDVEAATKNIEFDD